MIQILMTKNKYYKKKFLFILQLIFSLLIVGTLIFFTFNYLHKISIQQKFTKQLTNNYNLSKLYTSINDSNSTKLEISDNSTDYSNSKVSNGLLGSIKIPKLNLYYPVYDELNEELLKIAPCKFYGTGINEYGNLCIAGHNYDNGAFFSNLHLLKPNDEIYLYTDNNNEFSYLVTSIYEVSSNDLSPVFDYDANKKLLTLVTCNNFNGNRVIVRAEAFKF